jgi:Zn-dependent peptidase ImmA (M78 family)/transcriptional regulator with XRE-family HTH domain
MVYRVNVNPNMIKMAREEVGLSFHELPKTLKNAEKWENGELKPTWNDLRNLAKKYKRPPVFYLMSEPPKEEKEDIIEFRSPERIEEYSYKLRLEIRNAKYRRNIFLNLNAEMGIELPDFSKFAKISSKEENPYKLAQIIRNFLNIPYEIQQKWIKNKNGEQKYDHSIFLYEWKEIFADLGILVFEADEVSEDEMSGMSLYFDKCTIIILNGKNSHNRRIFTLFHELAHLAKRENSICDVDKYNKKETFCNKVAANALVPDETLTDDLIFFKNGKINYSGLSNNYGVSRQVIVYRLANLNKISQTEKNDLIKITEDENKRKKEKKEERNKFSKGGGMSKIVRSVKFEGKPFTRFILNAYENNSISASKFMRYLDFPIDMIDLLHEEIYG